MRKGESIPKPHSYGSRQRKEKIPKGDSQMDHKSFHFLQKVQLRYNLTGPPMYKWSVLDQSVLTWP